MNCHRLVLALSLTVLLSTFITENISIAADITCRFKSPTEPVEISVLSNGSPIWNGKIDKDNPKSVDIPEGPFTVISKVYNANLKTTGEIRAEAHTRMCQKQGSLSVPLFVDAP